MPRRSAALALTLALISTLLGAPAAADAFDDDPPLLRGRAMLLGVVSAPLLGEPFRARMVDTGMVERHESARDSRHAATAQHEVLDGEVLRAGVETVQADAAPRVDAWVDAGRLGLAGPGVPRVEVRGLQVRAEAGCGTSRGRMRLGYLAIDGEVVVDEETEVTPNTAVTGGPRAPVLVMLNEQVGSGRGRHGVTVRGIRVLGPAGDLVYGLATAEIEGCDRVDQDGTGG